ncbi:alpha/beta hydrolase [Sphingobium sufflavum]|uniref:alpha/beta hydrolase n=1 Tax=Sphingobium sufflavum TaxID=1129547 RepID=UPI001F35FDCC|nr:alpha/beta hydrolase [Sphingobium sufflavum]MCE7797146.1 alpha/beta hydrolase [Sphingobium sufflavum]
MMTRTLPPVALMLSALMVAATAPSFAQTPDVPPDVMKQLGKPPEVITAPPEPDAIPLYGARTPGNAKTENWSREGENVVVRNVTRPTLAPVLPDPAKATGAAVIVAPGGGFTALSTETEGYQVARALADRGIAAFVLKYRLVATPADEIEARMFGVRRLIAALANPASGAEALRNKESTEDGLAALKMVRSNAAKWGIDPARVGMIGFSAGAMTSLAAGLTPEATDRPAFIGYIYGPQIAVPVPANAPALFDAIAVDDVVFPTMGFPIVEGWLKAKRPVELHAYGRGNHGFGVGRKGTTPSLLINEFVAWLSMEGFLGAAAAK